MSLQLIFNFKTDISEIPIPEELNNPFETTIPKIAQIATSEFQEYITTESKNWNYNFETQKGKMFGVLVVKQSDYSQAYLGAVSGVLNSGTLSDRMVPNVFQENPESPFISEGLIKIKKLSAGINKLDNEIGIHELKRERKALSNSLQKKMFEKTNFINNKGEYKNVLQIFEDRKYGYPPSAAGECSAPKLLQYAMSNKLKPIAITEFWWGNAPKTNERIHKNYYPACKDKCRPILEYMLTNSELY